MLFCSAILVKNKHILFKDLCAGKLFYHAGYSIDSERLVAPNEQNMTAWANFHSIKMLHKG